MMKKTLGKLLILLSLALNLSANVTASVNAPAIYKGESITFTISANGDTVIFPVIDEIDSNPILGTSSSQSTIMINGDVTKKVAKIYTFSPQKSLTIPSFKVSVNGKDYHTKEIKISVLKPTASKKGSDFIVEMHADKKEAYVGESINLSISFKQKLDAHANKLQLGEPKLENFWVKKVDDVEKSNEGAYIIQKIHYVLFPQKEGNYTIPSIEAAIGKASRSTRAGGAFNDSFFNDPFFNSFATRLQWQKIFSNEEKLTIKALPNNLELYGAYQIKASVNKKTVHANKPVNLTIHIKGEGNIDDIKKFDLDIDNAIVYADEPKISSNLVNNTYQGEFTQKIAIIADSNYTIPPISLSYFDKGTKEVKTIQTKPIMIEVKGNAEKVAKPSIEQIEDKSVQSPKNRLDTQKVMVQSEKSYLKYIFLLIGLLLGLGIAYIFNRIQKQDIKKEQEMIKSIKKAKTDKALFDVLLPFSKKDKMISEALGKLEENIYKNGHHQIDKDALMDIFEELEASENTSK